MKVAPVVRILRHPYLRVAAIPLVVLGIYLIHSFMQVPPNTIYLRESGFVPEEITIEPGTTVTFVNKTRHAFWPASNAHPQHSLYADFDAGQPIASGESWSFTFAREGKWGFHDHLRSYYTGVITVGEEAAAYHCLDHIAELSVGDKRECWSDELASALRKEGAAAAFKKFATFYASDPDFSTIGCHSIAHQMGDIAYGEYVRYGNTLSKLQFPPESVYCGYGYYHGILEHKIRDHPDFADANAFCEDLIEGYQDTVPRIRENCYHAIGHGFIPEPTDIEMWGNAKALAAPAIDACRNLEDTTLRAECMQGAFNVISDWMWNNQFGFRMPEEDSLGLCRSFDDPEVSSACYYELSMKVVPYANGDIPTLYKKFAASITDDAIAGMVMSSAVAAIMSQRINDTNFIPLLKECRTLPARVQVDCLQGITGGFVAHGEPEREYVKAIAFCADAVLTDAEKHVCYQNIVRTFKGVYSREKVAEVCTLIEPAYREYCAYD